MQDDGHRASRSHRLMWLSVLVGASLSLALTAAIAAGSLFIGSREGRWFYPYIGSFSFRAIAIAAAGAASAAALLHLTTAGTRRREWLLVTAWIVLATGLQGLMRTSGPYTLESVFVSDAASSFYGVSRQYDASEVLAHYNRVRARTPMHSQSNMPGKLMLVYGLRVLSERTDILPWFVILLSNGGAWLMYFFVRDLFGDRRTALYAAVLYLFVPARIFFFPILNTVTPVIVLACACLLLRWLRTGRTIWAVLVGASLYGLAFFEPLPLVMGLLGTALVVTEARARALPWGRIVQQSAIALVAFIAVAELVTWSTDFEIIRTFRQIGGHAAAFNTNEGRPYWLWVRWNLLEFVVGVGACQAVLFFAALIDGVRSGQYRHDRSTPIVTLCTCLLAILVMLDLLGINRGEVIRLWIFLACFFQIPAAYLCASFSGRTAMAIVVSCTIVHAAVGVARIGFVIP